MALPITQRDQEKLADLANYLMGQGVCVTREIYAAAQIEAFDVQ